MCVFNCVWLLGFSAENILQKNRSRKARVDPNGMKFVFCMKNWFLGFIIPLSVLSFLAIVWWVSAVNITYFKHGYFQDIVW